MQKPEICRITTFEHGETVQLFGENFTEGSSLYWWRREREEDTSLESCGFPNGSAPEFPPENALCYKIRDVINNQVAYVGGENWVPSGTGIFWVKNEEGFSKPFVANLPVIWNQSARSGYCGGSLSLYGDCFWSKFNKRAYFKSLATGEFFEAKCVNSELEDNYYGLQRHRANLIVPELPEGEYEVYFHSGFGSECGWSEPVKYTVKKECTLTEYFRNRWDRGTLERIAMPKTTVFSVTANPLGALFDITDEIQGALDKAYLSGGGIVTLSAGTFGISRPLILKKGVVLLGAGQGATTITDVKDKEFVTDWSDVVWAKRANNRTGFAIDWMPHIMKYNNNVLIRIYEDAGVEGLTLTLTNGINIGVLVSNNVDYSFGAFINDVMVDARGQNLLRVKGFGAVCTGVMSTCSTEELTIFKCNIYTASPIYINSAKNYFAHIIRNRFETVPKNQDECLFFAIHYSVFAENEFVNGMRSYACRMGFDNNFVYQNKAESVGKGWNANEVFMSEHGESEWGGKAAEIGENYVAIDRKSGLFHRNEGENNENCRLPNNLSFGDMNNDTLKEVRFWLCVLGGRGFGQYREVVAVEDNRLILDKPWVVLPDSDTYFTLVAATTNNIWLDNSAAFCNSHSQFIWDGGIENIIAGHEMRMSAGIRLHSLFRKSVKDTTSVVAFNRIIHCEVKGSGKGIWIGGAEASRLEESPKAVRETAGGIFGNSVRACFFDGGRNMHYIKNLPYTTTDRNPHCGVSISGGFNTLCRNRIGGYTVGIKLEDNCLGNCFDNNYYQGNDVNMVDCGRPIGNDISEYRAKNY